MKGGYKIIDFKHIPLSDAEHPALVPDLRAVLDENYGKAVLLTNVVLGEDSMDDCFSTVILKSNGRIKLNSYDGYITVDSDSYAHYTEGGSGDPTAEIEEIKEDIQDIQTDIGDLSDLTTEEQSSLVGSVNEVNGKVDDVSEDLGDISDLETETKTSSVDAINELSTKLSKTEDLISIVENGNTCTHTGGISKGQYVNWKGDLYTADSNISVGATFASSGGSKNLTAVADGGLNDFCQIDISSALTVDGSKLESVTKSFYKMGSLFVCNISGYMKSDITGDFTFATIPTAYAPKINVGVSVSMIYNGSLTRGTIAITSNGDIKTSVGSGTINRQWLIVSVCWMRV